MSSNPQAIKENNSKATEAEAEKGNESEKEAETKQSAEKPNEAQKASK